MVLVDMLEMLRKAQKGKYAVGYFESWSHESICSVIKAAKDERSPVIVGFNGSKITELGYDSDLEYYAAIGKVAVERSSVPTVLILNEASDYQQITRGLRLGFNCVMFDGSSLPFEKNVEVTRKIVQVAHSMGARVEGQFDVMPEAKNGIFSGKLNEDLLTKPKKASRFVEKTDIDALAISVGTVHGLFGGTAKIYFEGIEAIKEATDVPLALHGATGVSDEDIKKAIRLGICKVNLGTGLRLAFINSMKVALEHELVSYPEEILKSAGQTLKEIVRLKIRIYGCAGKSEIG